MAKCRTTRILKTFGKALKNENRKKREKMRKAQKEYNKDKPLSLSTENSVRPIYIASGGLNKSY